MGVTIETMLRLAQLTVATLLLAMATAMPAAATPVYDTCYELNGNVGYYEWAIDEHGNFTDSIYVDNCALHDLGAGPNDYAQVLEHEQGHAQGLSHSSVPSDTMYPEMLITGY